MQMQNFGLVLGGLKLVRVAILWVSARLIKSQFKTLPGRIGGREAGGAERGNARSGPYASEIPSGERLHEPRKTRLKTMMRLMLRLVLLIRLACTSGAMAPKNGAKSTRGPL